MTDDLSGSATTRLVLSLFVLIGALMLGDLRTDYLEGVSLMHVLVEAAVLLLAAAGIAIVMLRVLRERRSLAALRSDLEKARRQAAHWQAENERQLRGIGEAIRSQFHDWEFTDAESDVALLLIKGLSHREIASLRDTSERTVRNQAQAAYRKAALPGRTALSAFFLEDMLPGR